MNWLLVMMAGCDDSPTPGEVETPIEVVDPTPPAIIVPNLPPEPAAEAEATNRSLSTVGARMVFDQATMTAPTGPLRLSYTSQSTEPAMLHNLLIVRAGAEDAVGIAGIDAGPDKGYAPDHEAVLAASQLLAPGESAEIFVTLKPGVYTYICTFPGHYLTEKGVLTVTE